MANLSDSQILQSLLHLSDQQVETAFKHNPNLLQLIATKHLDRSYLNDEQLEQWKLIRQLYYRCNDESLNFGRKLIDIDDFTDRLKQYYHGKRYEEAIVYGIQGDGKLVDYVSVGNGRGEKAVINVQAIVEFAAESRSDAIIFVHNHPSPVDSAEPSKEDIETMKLIKQLLDICGVPLIDSIIFSGNDSYSFALETDLLGKNFKGHSRHSKGDA